MFLKGSRTTMPVKYKCFFRFLKKFLMLLVAVMRVFLDNYGLKIFLVLIIPLVVNIILLNIVEQKILTISLPPNFDIQELARFSKQMSQDPQDTLSKINPDLFELLRYNFYLVNNVRLIHNQTLLEATSTLIYHDDSEIGQKLTPGNIGVIAKNLSYDEAIEKLMNFSPVLEKSEGFGGTFTLSGGWRLIIRPTIGSAAAQYLVLLIIWFQIIQILQFIFYKKC